MRYLCSCCGKFVTKVERHHTFYKTTKNRKLKPFVDDAKNIALVCVACHGTQGTSGGMANGYPFKVRYWKQQCALFGSDAMREWYDGTPHKVKENFE